MSVEVVGPREGARRIAAVIRASREELLDRWIARARADTVGVPRAAALEREALIDYVPRLIDSFSDALERIDPEVDPTVAARDAGALDAAVRHAEHRIEQGYSITEVLRELAHFRVATMDLCHERGTPLMGPPGRLVHALIDHAITGGAETIDRHELALLEADRKRVEELSRAKDDFAAVVSHEIRTPLNVILGWAQLALARPNLDPTIARALQTIERNATLQARLIDDLLDFTRMRTGKLSLELKPLDALDAVRTAVEGVRPAAQAKHIELAMELPTDAPRVMGDFDRLHQVFANLLANALKFTPPKGRVQVTSTRGDGVLRVAVEDTGVGIAPELLPDIFDPFQQGDPAAGKRKGGVGLGLALVRELAQLHGGRASAESPGVGRGATFVVELPVIPEPAPS